MGDSAGLVADLQLQMLLGSWSWTPPRTSPTQSSLSSINKRSFCNYNGGHSVQVDLAQRCHHKLKCSINQGGAGENFPDDQQLNLQRKGFWNWDKWKANSDEMKSKLAKLGLAAVLAYGLFDAVTYTSFFVLAFLGYEKSTGKNPAANLQALFGKQHHEAISSGWSSSTGTFYRQRIKEDPEPFQVSKSWVCICTCCFCSGCFMFNRCWLAYPIEMGKMS